MYCTAMLETAIYNYIRLPCILLYILISIVPSYLILPRQNTLGYYLFYYVILMCIMFNTAVYQHIYSSIYVKSVFNQMNCIGKPGRADLQPGIPNARARVTHKVLLERNVSQVNIVNRPTSSYKSEL